MFSSNVSHLSPSATLILFAFSQNGPTAPRNASKKKQLVPGAINEISEFCLFFRLCFFTNLLANLDATPVAPAESTINDSEFCLFCHLCFSANLPANLDATPVAPADSNIDEIGEFCVFFHLYISLTDRLNLDNASPVAPALGNYVAPASAEDQLAVPSSTPAPAPAQAEAPQQVICSEENSPPPPKRQLEPGKDYLVSHLRLDRVGVCAHAGLLILQCRHCRGYLAYEDIKGHMASHKIGIGQAHLDDALLLCQEIRIYKSQNDVSLPTPLGPPIQDLNHVSGYICRQPGCGYGAVSPGTMTAHESAHGLKPLRGQVCTRKRVALQLLFQRHKRYFAVDMDLAALSKKPDLTRYISETFLPSLIAAPTPILTAADDRGRAPLERTMKWDSLLLHVRENHETLQQLGDLKAMPCAEDEGIFSRLPRVVTAWCKRVETMMKGHPASNDLERVIILGDGPLPLSRCVHQPPHV